MSSKGYVPDLKPRHTCEFQTDIGPVSLVWPSDYLENRLKSASQSNLMVKFQSPLHRKNEQFRSESILAIFLWESANCKRNKLQAWKMKVVIIAIPIFEDMGHWIEVCIKICMLEDQFGFVKVKDVSQTWYNGRSYLQKWKMKIHFGRFQVLA